MTTYNLPRHGNSSSSQALETRSNYPLQKDECRRPREIAIHQIPGLHPIGPIVHDLEKGGIIRYAFCGPKGAEKERMLTESVKWEILHLREKLFII